MAENPSSDRIILRGMVFHGHHGVTEEERREAQKFVVDLTAACETSAAAEADDLDLTIDYNDLYMVTKGVLLGPSCKLLETLAEQVAAKVLKHFPAVSRVIVRVKKTRPPIKGELDWAAVEITRRR